MDYFGKRGKVISGGTGNGMPFHWSDASLFWMHNRTPANEPDQ
jgi:hypothetical protein